MAALREFPGSLSCRGAHAVVLAALGEAGAATAEIESVERECPSFALTAFFRAIMAAASRDKAGLLRWVSVVRERGIEVPWGLRNPALFGEYASDPEYLAVVGSGSELDAARLWRAKARGLRRTRVELQRTGVPLRRPRGGDSLCPRPTAPRRGSPPGGARRFP